MNDNTWRILGEILAILYFACMAYYHFHPTIEQKRTSIWMHIFPQLKKYDTAGIIEFRKWGYVNLIIAIGVSFLLARELLILLST